jgi:hypothetical protein
MAKSPDAPPMAANIRSSFGDQHPRPRCRQLRPPPLRLRQPPDRRLPLSLKPFAPIMIICRRCSTANAARLPFATSAPFPRTTAVISARLAPPCPVRSLPCAAKAPPSPWPWLTGNAGSIATCPLCKFARTVATRCAPRAISCCRGIYIYAPSAPRQHRAA